MTITTTIAKREVDSNHKEIGFFSRGCFGVHNHLDDFSLPRWDGNHSRIYINTLSSELEILNFWFHGNNDQLREIPDAVETMNSMACYKDMFTYNSAGAIEVNLRTNPADKVFTGLMTIRDVIYGYYRGLEFLYDGIDDKEELLKRKRIALALRLAGASADMFGRWNFDHSRYDAGDESAAVYIDSSMPAISLMPLILSDETIFPDMWPQAPVGEGRNVNGYIRNHSSSQLRAVARDYGWQNGGYTAMSHWLRLWSLADGHKPESMDARRQSLTVGGFFNRIETRMRNTSREAQAEVVISLFDELKEFCHD